MQDELLSLLNARRGHFQMESGYHSDAWHDLDQLFADRARLAPLAEELARRLAAHAPEVICGPMTGGAKLAEMIGAYLGLPSFGTDRHETTATGLFPVRYLVPDTLRQKFLGRRVAIVDDAVSAGSAVKGSFADLVACDAQPVAIGALIVFGSSAHRFAFENRLGLEGIAHTEFNLWKPGQCPLCAQSLPFECVSDTKK